MCLTFRDMVEKPEKEEEEAREQDDCKEEQKHACDKARVENQTKSGEKRHQSSNK